jgi:hypothetical protein
MESIELAQSILKFYDDLRLEFGFKELVCRVDSADQGFISLLNTEARRKNLT